MWLSGSDWLAHAISFPSMFVPLIAPSLLKFQVPTHLWIRILNLNHSKTCSAAYFSCLLLHKRSWIESIVLSLYHFCFWWKYSHYIWKLTRGVNKKSKKPSNQMNQRLITVFHGSLTYTVIKIEKSYFTVWLRFSVSIHDYKLNRTIKHYSINRSKKTRLTEPLH